MRLKPHSIPPVCIAAAAAASLAACAALPRGPRVEALNVESPAAGAIMTVQAQRLPFPSFRDVPPKPGDIPAPAGYAVTVASLDGERHTLNAWTIDNPAMIGGTEDYAAVTRQGVGSTSADAPQQDVTPAISAWAKAMRDAAAAPPPKPAEATAATPGTTPTPTPGAFNPPPR